MAEEQTSRYEQYKQDRQGVRTPADVEIKYNLGQMIQLLEEHLKNQGNPHGVNLKQLAALGFKRILTSDDDMNNLIEEGVYAYLTASRPKNCPYKNAGIVEVIYAGSDTTRIIQRVTRYGVAGQTTFRTLYENNWNDWTEVALKSDTYFASGDIISTTIHTSGYVTTSGTQVYFVVPISKCVPDGLAVSIASGNGFILRQSGKYTHGSSSNGWVTPSSCSAWLLDSQTVQVRATFSDTTNVTNNDAIGVQWDGTITFS